MKRRSFLSGIGALAAQQILSEKNAARAGRPAETPSIFPPTSRRPPNEQADAMMTILPDSTRFIDAEKALRQRFGRALESASQEDLSRAIVRFAEQLPPGGAIELPRSVPCGELDFRGIADNIQITGGHSGKIIFGGGQKGIQILFSRLDQAIRCGVDRPTWRGARRDQSVVRLAAADLEDIHLFDPKAQPATDLIAMFCEGGIQIDHDVRHCAWIAGANAFGAKTVTANARVDDSLFLWFGINWPFADYNAHRDPKNAGRNWLDHTQMSFDCKGGGQGTRLYLMVETNYGNPGPGVVLQNCKGMALYHGSTERSSSQGPGTYWIKDCSNMQLGLRAINAFHPPGMARSPDPAHDITIEGGTGNILHVLKSWGFASGATAVNSDPDLQAWMTGFQYETAGFETPSVLRFAYTPGVESPTPAYLEKLQPSVADLAQKILQQRNLPVTPEALDQFEKAIRTGRFIEAPLNAQAEETFMVDGVDLTTAPRQLPGGKRLPAPPSIPATDAPQVNRPVAFTQTREFGKALLDAGADPTGKKPSDDAFAKVMYGMSRDELQKWLEQTYAGDAEFRAARARKDDAAMKAAQAKIDEGMDRLTVREPGAKRPNRRPRVEIPPGTFLLTRTLVQIGGNNEIWGAGPEQTVLKFQGDIKGVAQHEWGTIANFTVDGGRVGLAVTGANHDDAVSPTIQSYIAGSNYFNLTFRNQTFAGMHIGNDEIEIMGGSEHDQNKYINLKFLNTGDYGIYMNQNMLDKWLFLHGEFEGQKKAGISIKFNNVIHGAIIGSRFRNINGPGLDILGGHPIIAYRPWLVMVDQCDFIECGNATQPAVEQGYGELMSFTRCRVETRQKVIKAGYQGSAQIYEDDTIDVRVPEGMPVMTLRAVRQVQTAMCNGHILRGVKANGPVAFVNDSNAYNETFQKTLKAYGKGPELAWDVNPAAHAQAPRNGWTHPFLFYRCSFGEKHYQYSLLNVNTDRGVVVKEIDLSALEG